MGKSSVYENMYRSFPKVLFRNKKGTKANTLQGDLDNGRGVGDFRLRKFEMTRIIKAAVVSRTTDGRTDGQTDTEP